jgi:small subunit ribosomal protein S16
MGYCSGEIMLKIKLARYGKRHQPEYRIVVNEAKDKRDGKYVALLGQYAPTRNPKILKLDLKAYEEWMKKGAQPTDTVASLAKRAASATPFPKKKPKLSKKAQEKAKTALAEKTAAKTQPKAEVAPTPAPEIVAATEAVSETEKSKITE